MFRLLDRLHWGWTIRLRAASWASVWRVSGGACAAVLAQAHFRGWTTYPDGPIRQRPHEPLGTLVVGRGPAYPLAKGSVHANRAGADPRWGRRGLRAASPPGGRSGAQPSPVNFALRGAVLRSLRSLRPASSANFARQVQRLDVDGHVQRQIAVQERRSPVRDDRRRQFLPGQKMRTYSPSTTRVATGGGDHHCRSDCRGLGEMQIAGTPPVARTRRCGAAKPHASRSAMLTPCLTFSGSCSQPCKPRSRPRQDLVLENLLLRHQLAVLTRPTRSRPRARLRLWDKLAPVLALEVPLRGGRPHLTPEVRDLIATMSRDSPAAVAAPESHRLVQDRKTPKPSDCDQLPRIAPRQYAAGHSDQSRSRARTPLHRPKLGGEENLIDGWRHARPHHQEVR